MHLRTLTFFAFALFSAPLVAQVPSAVPKAAADGRMAAAEAKKTTESKVQRLDADLNEDGILDAAQSLSLLKKTSAGVAKEFADPQLQKELTAGFRKARQPQGPTKVNSCMDYLLLSPAEKDRVNQKIQSRTLGVFGTRPCDPFVSPMLERPYDDNYVVLPLLPHTGVVIRD